MGGESSEICIPKALIVPAFTTNMTVFPLGTLILSGAKLWVATAANTFQIVTSA